jgi:hypothetical protein
MNSFFIPKKSFPAPFHWKHLQAEIRLKHYSASCAIRQPLA